MQVPCLDYNGTMIGQLWVKDMEKFKEKDQELNKKKIETEKMLKKLCQGRKFVEDKLQELIEEGSSDSVILESTTRLYVSLFEEDDFPENEDKVLKVNQGTFLEKVNVDTLNDKQTKTVEIIQEFMKEMFENQVMVRSRRVSVSIKRMKPEEFENDDPPNSRKARTESESFDSCPE